MKRRISFLLILLIILCLAGRSWAYEAAVLKSADIGPYNEALEGFRSSCDCSVTTLTPDQDAVTSQIYRLHPDVVVAIGMDALAKVRSVENLPVIYVMVPAPLSDGEGRNISGVSMYISPAKYLDAMTRLFPGAKRIGLVYDPNNSDAYVKEAMREAAARGIELVAEKAETSGSVPSLMDSLKERIDIFWMLPEPGLLNSATVDYMLLFSFESKVPIFTFSKKYVDMGAAAALTVGSFDMGAQAGAISKRLHEAGAPGQIRVDARVSGIIVNSKVLRKLGIESNKNTAGWAKNVD
ncbi:MAG: ABC transporter substrate binding protein [Candidatus Sulfobium sp.]|jgi:putative ABC transport system substrate-binding protein